MCVKEPKVTVHVCMCLHVQCLHVFVCVHACTCMHVCTRVYTTKCTSRTKQQRLMLLPWQCRQDKHLPKRVQTRKALALKSEIKGRGGGGE